ncbi:hypothetical protein IFM89_035945 [Coptis chinensis]|uniref:RNase H type-1 domain-containing protein n=1 Tax=Coptis chinensis TaxID=261450 RepID=A0A835H2L5_9MAGN|nr:hypothetical protein IFM89_035945 [Coptis chinensis]
MNHLCICLSNVRSLEMFGWDLDCPFSVAYYTIDTIRDWLQHMVKCLDNEADARMWMTTLGAGLWTIWLARNDIIFNEKPKQPLRWVIKARKITEIMAAIVDTRPQNSAEKIEINVKWDCPPTGWIKLNTDGSSLENPGATGAGCLFRDENAIAKELIKEIRTLFSEGNFVMKWSYREANYGADALATFAAHKAKQCTGILQ